MVTIKDVATKAEVSVTTVSRVINNSGYVNKNTRERVEAAIKELNYVPNELARSLFSKKSNFIGLMIPNISDQFFTDLAESIEYVAVKKGYRILLCNTLNDKDREIEYLQMFKHYNAAGVIMTGQVSQVKHYKNLNIPIVSITHKIDPNIPSISSNNHHGGQLAADKFIRTGAKRILHIDIDEKSEEVDKRTAGFKNTLRNYHISYEQLIVNSLHPDLETIYTYLKENNDIDAIFASTDLIAIQTLEVLKKMNKKIPEDIQVIGYNNITFSAFYSPGITTIDQNIKEIAEQAVEKIDKMINNEEFELHKKLPVKLIERGTTKTNGLAF